MSLRSLKRGMSFVNLDEAEDTLQLTAELAKAKRAGVRQRLRVSGSFLTLGMVCLGAMVVILYATRAGSAMYFASGPIGILGTISLPLSVLPTDRTAIRVIGIFLMGAGFAISLYSLSRCGAARELSRARMRCEQRRGLSECTCRLCLCSLSDNHSG